MINSELFVDLFRTTAVEAHQTAIEKGWWEGEKNDGEMIALIHSELSECLEGMRCGNLPSDHIPYYSSVEEELADAIIRIMDFSVARKHNVARAIVAKMDFNKNRTYKHGGKRF